MSEELRCSNCGKLMVDGEKTKSDQSKIIICNKCKMNKKNKQRRLKNVRNRWSDERDDW